MKNEDIADYLEEHATFIRSHVDGNVWEFSTMEEAHAALKLIGKKASEYNWAPNQQAFPVRYSDKGEHRVKPQLLISPKDR